MYMYMSRLDTMEHSMQCLKSLLIGNWKFYLINTNQALTFPVIWLFCDRSASVETSLNEVSEHQDKKIGLENFSNTKLR